MTANTNTCHCGDEPAIGTDSWTGEPVGEWCAKRTDTEPLTVQMIVSELRDAATEDTESYTGYQNRALERIASLLVYQQQRITDLEAAVAKLTGESS